MCRSSADETHVWGTQSWTLEYELDVYASSISSIFVAARLLRRLPGTSRLLSSSLHSTGTVNPGVQHHFALPYLPRLTSFLPSRISWKSHDHRTCFQPIALRPAETATAASSSIQLANKSFSLNELFTRQNLDFMFLTETWQREGEFIHLNELCPAGCSVVGVPRPCRRGGGHAVLYQASYTCKVVNSQTFLSFE